MPAQSLLLFDTASVRNLGVLTRRAMKLDHRALARFGNIAATSTQIWLTTPFGPVAGRTLRGQASSDHMVSYADALAAGTAEVAEDSGFPVSISAGMSAESSWENGPLPPATQWQEIDAIPAAELCELERHGRQLAEVESGPLGPPQSLLDSVVVEVSALEIDGQAGEEAKVEVTMRDVFALGAMGFIPENPGPEELVRVSKRGRWHRLDARFGVVAAASGSFGVLPL